MRQLSDKFVLDPGHINRVEHEERTRALRVQLTNQCRTVKPDIKHHDAVVINPLADKLKDVEVGA